jgi:hypothetical protein
MGLAWKKENGEKNEILLIFLDEEGRYLYNASKLNGNSFCIILFNR